MAAPLVSVRRTPPAAVALAIAGVIVYLALVVVANTPLGAFGTIPVWQAVLWNYGSAGAFLALIHVLTRGVRRPLPELPADAQALRWLILVLVVTAGLVELYWLALSSAWPPLVWAMNLGQQAGVVLGLPLSVLVPLENVMSGALLITATTVSLSVWRVRRCGAIGFHFQRVDWLLGAVLILLAIGASYVEDHLFFGGTLKAMRYVPTTLWALPTFLLGMLVNSLQEETLLRGYVLPQLFAFLRRPWLAMVLMIVLFDALHLPSEIYGAQVAWGPALLSALFPLQPTGLVLGYAYWRSRSLVPGILLHTYWSFWAFFFL